MDRHLQKQPGNDISKTEQTRKEGGLFKWETHTHTHTYKGKKLNEKTNSNETGAAPRRLR